jgi:Carbonic anhydrase
MASAMMLVLLLGVTSCCSNPKNDSAVKENVVSAQLQDQPTDEPLTLLKKGNQRFVLNTPLNARKDSVRLQELIQGQAPKAVIVSCSDSRVPPEVIFDQGLGDLFVIRTAGNVMGDYELGSVEYAAAVLKTKLIVVLGHSSCGAVNATIKHNHKGESVPGHIASIVKAIGEGAEVKEVLANKNSESLEQCAVDANVIVGVKQLRNCDPILSELYKSGEIQIVGAVYHIETGEVIYMDI